MIEPLKFTDLGSFEEFATMEIDRLQKEVAAWKGIHEGAVLAMQAEITRLKEKCDKQTMILRRLSPDKFPDTFFITGGYGERDKNNMPERVTICPAYGVDFSYVYEYNGKTMGAEW